MTLYIFNPEHDLCLANGDPNYMPPASALSYAHTGLSVMKILYGDDAEVIAADDFAQWYRNRTQSSIPTPDLKIIPWGWDLRLKRLLQKQGCPEGCLPSDEWLATLRQLQHRSTIVPLQPHATCASNIEEIERLLTEKHRIVMKAPWSGAGRGVRFVDGALSNHDRHWAEKVIVEQGCVIVERRLNVKEEYALEYSIAASELTFTGLSLFVTQSGVYRHNILLSDDEIRKRVKSPIQLEHEVSQWINNTIVGRYEGPLGVDMILDTDDKTYVSEMNLRHTMGMVAHATINCNEQLLQQ